MDGGVASRRGVADGGGREGGMGSDGTSSVRCVWDGL